MVQKNSAGASEGETLVAQAPLKDSGPGTERPAGDAASEAPKAKAGEKIREEASKLGGQAADRARAYAADGKDKATGALDEMAKLMAGAANDVDDRFGPEYGKYARSAADGVSSFAESLRGKQVDELIEDATALVKKSPMIAVGTAAAVGFVLARLIKSGIDAAADMADRDDDSTAKS